MSTTAKASNFCFDPVLCVKKSSLFKGWNPLDCAVIMSEDQHDDGESLPLFTRRPTLPNNRNTTYEDLSSDSDDVPATRRVKATRGYYYGSDTTASDSTSAEEDSSDDPGVHVYTRSRRRGGRKKRANSRERNNASNSIYPFSLSGHHRPQSFTDDSSSNKESDAGDGSDNGKPESSESSAIWHRTVKHVENVYDSRYTGEKVLYGGGLQSAELKTSQYDGKSSQSPLFQWM